MIDNGDAYSPKEFLLTLALFVLVAPAALTYLVGLRYGYWMHDPFATFGVCSLTSGLIYAATMPLSIAEAKRQQARRK